jgi:hypothetical protein
MKNKIIQNANALPRTSVLILGALITLFLFLLGYFKALYLDLEIVLTPFIVVTLLTYGDKFLFVFFMLPISFLSKGIRKLNPQDKNNY